MKIPFMHPGSDIVYYHDVPLPLLPTYRMPIPTRCDIGAESHPIVKVAEFEKRTYTTNDYCFPRVCYLFSRVV